MKSTLQSKVSDMKEDIDYYKDNLKNSLVNRLNNYRTRLEGEVKRINALNPKAVLNRGYSLLQNDKGHVITSIKEVKENDVIITSLQDGSITSVIKEVKNDGREN